MSEDLHDPDRLANVPVRKAIRLANENDEHVTSTLDAGQLRRIAESMGAGTRALDALNEARDAVAAQGSRLKRLRRVQRFLLGASSLGLAWTARFVEALFVADSSVSLLPAVLAPLAGLALFLAVYNRQRGDQHTYQLDNAAIWAGFTTGWSILTSQPSADILPGAICWAAFAALGSVVVRRGGASPPVRDADEMRSWWARILRRSSEYEEPVERRRTSEMAFAAIGNQDRITSRD